MKLRVLIGAVMLAVLLATASVFISKHPKPVLAAATATAPLWTEARATNAIGASLVTGALVTRGSGEIKTNDVVLFVNRKQVNGAITGLRGLVYFYRNGQQHRASFASEIRIASKGVMFAVQQFAGSETQVLDILLGIDGKPFSTGQAYVDAIHGMGRSATLTYIRDGVRQSRTLDRLSTVGYGAPLAECFACVDPIPRAHCDGAVGCSPDDLPVEPTCPCTCCGQQQGGFGLANAVRQVAFEPEPQPIPCCTVYC